MAVGVSVAVEEGVGAGPLPAPLLPSQPDIAAKAAKNGIRRRTLPDKIVAVLRVKARIRTAPMIRAFKKKTRLALAILMASELASIS